MGSRVEGRERTRISPILGRNLQMSGAVYHCTESECIHVWQRYDDKFPWPTGYGTIIVYAIASDSGRWRTLAIVDDSEQSRSVPPSTMPSSSSSSSSTLFPVAAMPISPTEFVPATGIALSFVSLTILLFLLLTLCFPLCPLLVEFFFCLFHSNFWFLQIGGKFRVCAVLASFALWTEACQIEGT